MNDLSSLPPWSQVRLVADRQRQVLWAFLGGLVLLPLSIVASVGSGAGADTAGVAFLAIVVLSRLAMAITVYRLSAAWGSKVAVLWAIGAFVPNLIGLVALLVANSRATAFLKRAGVKVGFLGVKLTETPPPGSRYADISDVFS